MSIEKPASHISAQVPASDSGTVTPAAIVGVARRRNTNTTSMTSAIVAHRVSCMSWTLARIVVVRSDSTEICKSAGIQALMSPSTPWMRSTVSMTLACACLVMMSRIEGCRLNHAAERVLRTPGVIAATEESRTTEPFTVRTTIGS